MKAQVLHKYDPEMKEEVWVTEQEMPDPKLEKSSDVIVKIGAAGVCRTDLHIIEGVWKHIQDPDGDLLPCVMGHENAGWIEEVGKDVTNFKKGDPVILHPLISGTDGTCLDCRRGNDMHAEAGAFPGLSMKEGGYSELLKTSVRNLIKIPLKEGRTLHHDVKGKNGSGKVFLRSAPAGTGIIAGGAIRSVCEVLGIQDVVAKSLGSANPHNVLKACVNGLKSQNSPKILSAIRGKKISDIVLKREDK